MRCLGHTGRKGHASVELRSAAEHEELSNPPNGTHIVFASAIVTSRDNSEEMEMSDIAESRTPERASGYRPEQPVSVSPVFNWPPQPVTILKFLFGFPGYFWPYQALFAALALVTWLYLTPDMDRMKSFSADWIALLFARNLMLLIAFVSAWHVRLYTLKAQGTDYKYSNRWLSVDNPTFLFRNQLLDNIFWNVCSAVPIWTAYEATTLWLQANGFAPTVSWQAHPVYCVVLTLLITALTNIHFYITHRFLHWRPIFKSAHYIHHKNVNFGPWSGMAMHPIEHLVYFSAVVPFWFIPSHPVHILFTLQFLAIGASLGHVGFDRVVLSKNITLNISDYMHYLHHKHFNVNYGVGGIVPLDKWLGTFHDGSEEATAAMKKRMRGRELRSRVKE
jgi:sterol desaturase/sphingolipid hydroxylase (fatty acid hydroxylase superfamily)